MFGHFRSQVSSSLSPAAGAFKAAFADGNLKNRPAKPDYAGTSDQKMNISTGW